ncbi:MAG: OmpA family protein [Marinilabiliales bacterium]
MKKYVLIAAIIISGIISVIAQEIEFDKDDFRSKDDYKAAKDYLKTAEEYYSLGVGGFSKALESYLEIYKLYDKNAALNYKIGNCYLFTFQKAKSIDYFKKAFEINRYVADDILFKIARGYHLNMEFDKAIEYYNKYKDILSPKQLAEKKQMILKYIQECENGKELVKNPVRVFIDNVGSAINSEYFDYSPLISADESMMIFTSRRADTEGGNRAEDGDFFEDIYVAYNNGNKWEPAKNIGKPLNTADHDATVGLSNDGQQLFTYTDKTGNGDIYVSELKGSDWTKPDDKTLKKYINTDYHECGASFSFDGKTMYFVSNKPDDNYDTKSYSNPMERTHDIFVSYWDEKKQIWGEPKNIGSTINTEYDEKSVFMHPDGRTLYFSSKGHNTMGDFDIFKSELQDDGTWSEPENLGYPINTPDDDRFFVMAASGKHGYYSTVKDDSYGKMDIYMITFRGPEKPIIQSNEDNLLANTAPVSETVMEESVEIKTMRLTILKGTIKDALTLDPLEASIEIIDNEKNEVISIQKSNSATGKYLVSLPSGKNYGIAVKAEGYLFHSENFNIPEATSYQEITKDILLNKMDIGSKIILKNIFFDYAKATLRPESYPELDRLVSLLNEFPTTKIKISGHTDSRGSYATNKPLSENRAKAVVDYLISKGIDASRLQYEGYADKQPIIPNAKTEEEHQQNRRVEFEVLSK